MKPTLDEFIRARIGENKAYPPNAYVREQGFKSLYVRVVRRLIASTWHEPVLDIASVYAVPQGKGTFTRLIARLRREYPGLTLYVECVSDDRFKTKLKAIGFLHYGVADFVLFPSTYDNR